MEVVGIWGIVGYGERWGLGGDLSFCNTWLMSENDDLNRLVVFCGQIRFSSDERWLVTNDITLSMFVMTWHDAVGSISTLISMFVMTWNDAVG
ncbi:hypothetical protein Hanom_Chr17g01569511 [Helianthus anomalus]